MSHQRRISPIRLVPMCAFLSLLLLCAAEATGWFAPLFFLPIALCMLPLAEERLYAHLILCDLLIAAVVLALPVYHYAWLAFVCVLAPYVPVRHALRNVKKGFLRPLLSIGIVLLWAGLVLFGLTYLNVRLLTMFPPLYTALIGLAVLLFLFLLDALYQLTLKWYRARLRYFLLPRA